MRTYCIAQRTILNIPQLPIREKNQKKCVCVCVCVCVHI